MDKEKKRAREYARRAKRGHPVMAGVGSGGNQKGDKGPGWKGGISRKWSHQFRAKRCWVCGNTKKLHIHHKDGDPKNNRRRNLVTLCASCHRRVHA